MSVCVAKIFGGYYVACCQRFVLVAQPNERGALATVDAPNHILLLMTALTKNAIHCKNTGSTDLRRSIDRLKTSEKVEISHSFF